MKSVQISTDLFNNLVRLVICHSEDPEVYQKAYKGLEDKILAMHRRSLYTASKMAESAEEREKARQSYLDEIGMLSDWRY